MVFGMVWYGMVWYGMVWYGMVWYGMVWYGMVWYTVLHTLKKCTHIHSLTIATTTSHVAMIKHCRGLALPSIAPNDIKITAAPKSANIILQHRDSIYIKVYLEFICYNKFELEEISLDGLF
jgi:hypothetical protein